MSKRLDSYKLVMEGYENGQASQFIHPFDRLKPGDRVYLVERVSGRERKANLADQDANLRSAVTKAGAKVVGKWDETVSGFDPYWLRQAAREAREAGATVLLAETTDRFIRNRLFHSVLRPNRQASNEQLAELIECVGGMRLMTHLHPDATPGEVRSYQRKRGQRGKKNRGGRPRTKPGSLKQRRLDKKRFVLFLHRRGWSVRRIANKRLVGVPKSTVQRWIQQAG